MLNYLRWNIINFLWPQLHKDILQLVRAESHKYFSAYEEDKKQYRAFLSTMQDNMAESAKRDEDMKLSMQRRHEENIASNAAIAEAIRSLKT